MPPSRNTAAAWRIRRGFGLSGWIVKNCDIKLRFSCAHFQKLYLSCYLPCFPDRTTTQREIRHSPHVPVALARTVKVGTARTQQIEFRGITRELGILLRRVAAAHHLDRLPAAFDELGQQFVHGLLAHAVAPDHIA